MKYGTAVLVCVFTCSLRLDAKRREDVAHVKVEN